MFFSRIAHRIYLRDYRRDRFRFPRKICILSGSLRKNDVPCPIEHRGYTPQQWFQFLQEQGQGDAYSANLIVPNDIDDSFAVIINPFGEAYPEEDLARRTTFHRIRKFINKGGLFVNTSGLAFYYTGIQVVLTGLLLENNWKDRAQKASHLLFQVRLIFYIHGCVSISM